MRPSRGWFRRGCERRCWGDDPSDWTLGTLLTGGDRTTTAHGTSSALLPHWSRFEICTLDVCDLQLQKQDGCWEQEITSSRNAGSKVRKETVRKQPTKESEVLPGSPPISIPKFRVPELPVFLFSFNVVEKEGRGGESILRRAMGLFITPLPTANFVTNKSAFSFLPLKNVSVSGEVCVLRVYERCDPRNIPLLVIPPAGRGQKCKTGGR